MRVHSGTTNPVPPNNSEKFIDVTRHVSIHIVNRIFRKVSRHYLDYF